MVFHIAKPGFQLQYARGMRVNGLAIAPFPAFRIIASEPLRKRDGVRAGRTTWQRDRNNWLDPGAFTLCGCGKKVALAWSDSGSTAPA